MTYKDWILFETLPKGWKVDKTVGSPLAGYVFCTNGKSVLRGQQRGLVKVATNYEPKEYEPDFSRYKKAAKPKQLTSSDRKKVNELARKRFQEKILMDIRADLMVCDLEGWDKMEYITELQSLLNSFVTNQNQ